MTRKRMEALLGQSHQAIDLILAMFNAELSALQQHNHALEEYIKLMKSRVKPTR